MSAYDTETLEHKGRTFSVEYHHDESTGAPWEEHDGHGPVTGWTHRAKAPGERVLCEDRGSYRYYDFAAAVRLARLDGWGAKGGEGLTGRAKAAHATEADFEHLRRWCADQWRWCGLVVTLLDDDEEPVDDAQASLWGIESDATEHLQECARELADEVLANLSLGMPA